ncbi:hypothetical protein L1987_02300 [Smallanthus sonchifolius]|uniref:Uncharacterized protein n=1 Tax=Smallanthus sonchifolius TaxID=185202 RepID=A0ACB9K7L2_9ASTR|nr:hypothetical protein L1987_02300 [Smallanthus sonchifolius]
MTSPFLKTQLDGSCNSEISPPTQQPILITLWMVFGGNEWGTSVLEIMLHTRKCGARSMEIFCPRHDHVHLLKKAGKDAKGHDLAAAMVGLSLNKGYNFSRYIIKAINDQINTAERFSVEPTPEHTTLFSHLINEAYVAPGDWRWFSQDSEPELSAHSDEQQQQVEEVESVDESSKSGDEEAGHDGAEGSDSEETESDSSDSDDASSQAHPRQQHAIPSEVEVSAQQQVQVSAASTDSASTPPSQQLYRRQRRRPQVQHDVAVTTSTEEVPVIVTLPVTSVQVAVTTPILTESVTITPSITPTTIITSTIPTTTEPISQPFNYGEFTQGFDFDTIFSSPIHNAEASTSRHPDPNEERIEILETQVAGLLETVWKSKEESVAQQAQINSLVDEVRILRIQRTGIDERLKNVMAQNELLIKKNNMILGHMSSLELRFDMQQKECELMVKLIADLTKKLDASGEKEKEKEKTSTPTGDEPCHPVDLTKDDDKDKDPEVGPSRSGDTSGGDKGKSAADVLKDLSDEEILYLEPDYSKEAQVDALYNLEEGEIDSGDDWDENDEDVVIEVPKGDGEEEYEFEDGEIFEVPSFESQLDTEAPKDKDMTASSSKGPTPVWQKTSIIDKEGETGMILAVSEAFNSLPKYDLVNLANRELLGHSNHAVGMGLWKVLHREARSGKFEVFKPQVPKRVKDKNARHLVTKKRLKKLVYKQVICETKIPMSKISKDILGDMWYWYVDPKTGEAVVIGKVRSESGCLVPRELIRVFDEVCFINFSVKDLETPADTYCMLTDEWTKFLASKYDKVIKFCLDYKKKMEAKDAELRRPKTED